MKKYLILPVFFGLLLSLPAATPAYQPSTDAWVNKDPNTRSVVKMMFYNNRSRVRIFGACSPTPCDWGVISVKDNDPKGVNSPSEGHPYEVIVNQSVARRTIQLVTYGDNMNFWMKSDFKDRRPSTESRQEFARQR